MAYIQGQSRSQTSLFPVSLDELIPEDHLVRVIDLYIAKLDLVQLGFCNWASIKRCQKAPVAPLMIPPIS